MQTRPSRSRAQEAIRTLNNDLAGKMLPLPYSYGNMLHNSHTRVVEYLTADYLQRTYANCTPLLEPNGASSFPDIQLRHSNGWLTDVEVKSFLRNRGNRNELGFNIASLNTLTASPEAMARYLHAYYVVWDLDDSNGAVKVNEIHFKNFASLVGYRKGRIRHQETRVRPAMDWEKRTIHVNTAWRALVEEYPELA